MQKVDFYTIEKRLVIPTSSDFFEIRRITPTPVMLDAGGGGDELWASHDAIAFEESRHHVGIRRAVVDGKNVLYGIDPELEQLVYLEMRSELGKQATRLNDEIAYWKREMYRESTLVLSFIELSLWARIKVALKPEKFFRK